MEISEEKVIEAYMMASDHEKKLFENLFGKEMFEAFDYHSIKTYEDACRFLEEEPLPDNMEIFHNGWKVMDVPKHIVALMKLETISRALWGRTWKPEPDADGSKWFHYPFFALYTKAEIDNMDKEERENLLSCDATNGAYAGFGSLHTRYRCSNAPTYFGFRLCQESSEKAEYFGKQFLELWAEYLKFGFEVGERLK